MLLVVCIRVFPQLSVNIYKPQIDKESAYLIFFAEQRNCLHLLATLENVESGAISLHTLELYSHSSLIHIAQQFHILCVHSFCRLLHSKYGARYFFQKGRLFAFYTYNYDQIPLFQVMCTFVSIICVFI